LELSAEGGAWAKVQGQTFVTGYPLQSFLFKPACRQRQGQQKSISASIPAMRNC